MYKINENSTTSIPTTLPDISVESKNNKQINFIAAVKSITDASGYEIYMDGKPKKIHQERLEFLYNNLLPPENPLPSYFTIREYQQISKSGFSLHQINHLSESEQNLTLDGVQNLFETGPAPDNTYFSSESGRTSDCKSDVLRRCQPVRCKRDASPDTPARYLQTVKARSPPPGVNRDPSPVPDNIRRTVDN